MFAIEDPGVYIAFEDVEIEYLRGRVEARLESAGTSPTGRARLSLRTVSSGMNSSGEMKVDTLSLKLRVVHFKLNGDKGSRVPNISYSQLSLTADVECELDFQYVVLDRVRKIFQHTHTHTPTLSNMKQVRTKLESAKVKSQTVETSNE